MFALFCCNKILNCIAIFRCSSPAFSHYIVQKRMREVELIVIYWPVSLWLPLSITSPSLQSKRPACQATNQFLIPLYRTELVVQSWGIWLSSLELFLPWYLLILPIIFIWQMLKWGVGECWLKKFLPFNFLQCLIWNVFPPAPLACRVMLPGGEGKGKRF